MSHRLGRKTAIAGGVALVMAVCLYFGNSSAFVKVPLLTGTTTTIVSGVHLIGDLGPAVAYVVETSDGLALIDAGLDDDAGKLKAEMKKLGLDWKRLRVVFLTHVHGDHCGGAERLRTETGARIYAGQNDASVLAAGEPREAFFGTFRMPHHAPHPTHVDVHLQGGESIPVGNVTFQILDTPGHTAGSICYLVEKGRQRILFSGDVIFRLGEKPLGTYTTYLAPRYRGNAREYMKSLTKLRQLPVPNLVLPGHPAASRPPQSPRINRQEWNAMLDRGMQEMEHLVERFDSDGANFLDGEPKQLLPDLHYFGDFKGGAVYGLSVGPEFAVVNAPGGAGLNEFLEQQRKGLELPVARPTAVLLTGCSERETAGLNDLVEQTQARVYVAEAGMAQIRGICPQGTTIVAINELSTLKPFSISPVVLGNRGTASAAYVLRSSNKTALFSGRIPTGGDRNTLEELLSPSAKSATSRMELIGLLGSLRRIHPDLWLPANPIDAQNANLYNREWQAILEKDYQAVAGFLRFGPP